MELECEGTPEGEDMIPDEGEDVTNAGCKRHGAEFNLCPKQRVAIARAYIGEPKVLFADEPSANLDSKNGRIIEELLFDLNKVAGTTLVLVTHDEHLAEKCQRTLHIDAGQLIDDRIGVQADVG